MKNLKDEIQSVVNVYKSGNLTDAEILSKQLLIENPKVVFLYKSNNPGKSLFKTSEAL